MRRSRLVTAVVAVLMAASALLAPERPTLTSPT
ncbi:hypothetical protein H4W34_002362 [Actinomadura algeriensis]|uniref:Uncharacterized protein n=1 Tax=Actinomadura algeriensis TaxID=1679523 RepID=A0ABR9JQ32_9ACTN|nr:hypothetical protein [Actinomadura algeriensis]